ncbi:MAG: YeeE/YedE family protein [Rhodocyclaceae bacterium]|nr:YeeE/YedE family protein [Rhodocyclaceae bacterium]
MERARLFATLAAGILFGLGLAVSGMTNPEKVLGFLDVTGDWDPSLLFVLGGAVSVTLVSFRFILRRPAPVLAPAFQLPTSKSIDAPLIIGAVLFGAGWGLSGYCPGPGLALLAAPGNQELWLFVPALFAGQALFLLWRRVFPQ